MAARGCAGPSAAGGGPPPPSGASTQRGTFQEQLREAAAHVSSRPTSIYPGVRPPVNGGGHGSKEPASAGRTSCNAYDGRRRLHPQNFPGDMHRHMDTYERRRWCKLPDQPAGGDRLRAPAAMDTAVATRSWWSRKITDSRCRRGRAIRSVYFRARVEVTGGHPTPEHGVPARPTKQRLRPSGQRREHVSKMKRMSQEANPCSAEGGTARAGRAGW